MATVRFQTANAKLRSMPDVTVAAFSLPAGWTCPAALDCLSKADRATGRITDGKAMVFRCFAATAESFQPSVRVSRWNNFEALRGLSVDAMAAVLGDSLAADRKANRVDVIRIHVSGDFFNQAYFDAWLAVAERFPTIRFYTYTKSLTYWVARLGAIPANLNLTASVGGRHDALIAKHGLRSAVVVYSPEEATERCLVIDHDDSHAAFGTSDFALLIHSTQPKGSRGNEAMRAMKRRGIKFAYSSS